ncbi:MAG: DnaB-like helicase C-terminal domain-containing protein [Candidatus Tectomicrobia bacterium]
MQSFHLQDEFTDPSAEQALIAAVARDVTLYWELLDVLSPDLFTKEAETWKRVKLTLETEQRPTIPNDWHPASEPHAIAQRLADLSRRRILAALQERIAEALFDDTTPATEVATLLEEEVLRVQLAFRESNTGRLQWASEILPQILADADARRLQREQTGQAVLGLPTGIGRLDGLLNGLDVGLHLLGGPPGMGKTTLALQIAASVSRDVPVVFVTFENSPVNLTLKALCAKGGINPRDVQRGEADLQKLQQAAVAWQQIACRLALVEGGGRLTVAQVRAHALRAMHQHQATRCLVVVDYLQLWAKIAEEFRGVPFVRERVEMLGGTLRELALQLHSPVLALSSQNRAQGNYGTGKGTAALDSLKESGDLEYMADVVLFMTEAHERVATPPARAVDLTVAKNRDGEIGKVALIFVPKIGILREVRQDDNQH